MTQTTYVTDHNPELFFQALADQIKAGFYADDTVEGFPHFDVINEVKLTRTDKPSQRHDHTNINEIHLTGWHNTSFVLDYQDAVLQGFVLVPESVRLGEMHEPHYLVMKRASAKPAQDIVSEDKGEAVAETAPEPEKAPEATTEAPVTEKRKGGRPPKIKEL